MVQFTRDFSDPQVLDLVVSKAINRRHARMMCIFVQIEMALLGLLVGYTWLRSSHFSILYPLAIILLLILAICYKKLQIMQTRKQIMYMEAQKLPKTEYIVDNDGVHVHTEHEDTLLHWSHFVAWGKLDQILYLETKDQKLIVCHQKQLSCEDFEQFQAQAAEHIHIEAQNKEWAL